MSQIAFAPLTAIENIFKSLIWDNVVSLFLTYAFAEVPILNLPILHGLTVYFVTLITDGIFMIGRYVTDMTSIKIVEPILLSKYETESIRLGIIAHNSGIDSDEFKKEREIEKQKFHDFIHSHAVPDGLSNSSS